MNEVEDGDAESGFDLALDCIPSGRSEFGGSALIARANESIRAAIRLSRRETAGWELTRDPVYEH